MEVVYINPSSAKRIEENFSVKHIFGQTKVEFPKVKLKPFEAGINLASLLTEKQEQQLDMTEVLVEFKLPTNFHHFRKMWEIFTFLSGGSIAYRKDNEATTVYYQKGTTVIIPPPVIRRMAPFYIGRDLLAHDIGLPRYNKNDDVDDGPFEFSKR